MTSNLKITFEIDEDGNFKASGNMLKGMNGRNFNASGKISLIENEESVFNNLRKFARELEYYCPAEYNYHSNSPSK